MTGLTFTCHSPVFLTSYSYQSKIYVYCFPGELLKLLNKICSCSGDKTKQDRAFEPLQEIVTFVQFANDECDYGMGLELGMDLFCHGDEYFHNVLQHLLPLAYELLGCKHYANICKLHLTCREKTPLNCTELE